MYNVLIVDDEFLARKLLQGYVSNLPDLNLLGTAQNAAEAFSIVNEHQVDILLLDIHMPDLNGIELARTLSNVPTIIFTTAYSEYALESYEVSAVDYLLKPIAFPRFSAAIEKAIAKLKSLEATAAEHPNPAIVETPQEASGQKTFMLVKADYRLYKINFDDLLYVEGQHEYVSFYTRNKRITALYSLKNLEEQLPADKFIRVHKSYIVSIDEIQEIEQLSITVAGQKLPVGGSYRDALMKKLNCS